MTCEELPKPAQEAYNVEVLRVWLTGTDKSHVRMQMTMQAGAFCDDDDPRGGAATWGVALADLARHVAFALHDGVGADEGLALADIQRFMNAELGSPTDETQTWRLDDDPQEREGS